MLLQQECNIIVDIVVPTGASLFKVKGHDPITHDLKISEPNRWWSLYANEIEVGDTIVKKRGELTFNIHKKDTVIVHKWKCDEN
ncbi:hypothetical protein C1631_016980 [Chryseobacterium phosphatilyticum]|uniref:Uncharacterized protein n=2 Tax=Chryseobacterium phosphatilyticum TaxID=475075 RepID=A0A316X3F2_9FLAO|nr:hypothetical protein C1631_016980 [Chryseobacterium phosphatilyticum]